MTALAKGYLSCRHTQDRHRSRPSAPSFALGNSVRDPVFLDDEGSVDGNPKTTFVLFVMVFEIELLRPFRFLQGIQFLPPRKLVVSRLHWRTRRAEGASIFLCCRLRSACLPRRHTRPRSLIALLLLPAKRANALSRRGPLHERQRHTAIWWRRRCMRLSCGVFERVAQSDPSSTVRFAKWLSGNTNPSRGDGVARHFRIA